MQQLPHGTVEQFTNTVQPLLINRCGAGNCHGPSAESSFQLAYPNWSRTLPRRFTQRNLYAALQVRELATPGASPLLAMSTLPHGGSPSRLSTSATRRSCSIWQSGYIAAPMIPDASLRKISAPRPRFSSRRAIDRRTPRIDHPMPIEPTRWPVKRRPSLPETSRRCHPARRPAAGPPTAPVTASPAGQGNTSDPFDPEIFNRRYLKRMP